MQYKVPQDVQREDTIIGPVTLKQMGILGAGGGLAYGIYITLAKAYFIEIWLPPVAFISLVTLAFAFLKIYGLPFHQFLMNLIEYYVLARKRIWIQGTGIPFIPPFDEAADEKKKLQNTVVEDKSKKTQSIAELTKILDSHGNVATEAEEKNKKEELKKLIYQNYKPV